MLDGELARLTREAAPALSDLTGVGPDVAGALLVAAGDNPDRLHSDSAFASLCGASPVPACSGKTNRYRLNRGGDRIANNALWRIVMVRLTCDARTQAYMAHGPPKACQSANAFAASSAMSLAKSSMPCLTRHRSTKVEASLEFSSEISPDSAMPAIRGSRSTACCETGDAACAAPCSRPDECVRE
jgi:Transposase IS116/IS110/IS902 family